MKDEEEATTYVPTFKSIDKVEKVGGQFVGNQALSIEQVNKIRKDKAEANEKKKQEDRFAKFNKKMQEEKRKAKEKEREKEEEYKR